MKTHVCYKAIAFFLVITLLFQIVAQPLQQSVFSPVSVQASQEQQVSQGDSTATILSETDGEFSTPEILSEVEEKRTADTKHFLLSDGSYMAVQYTEPVHYQDENGTWQQYDNSVTEENDQLKNKKSDKDIRLSNKSKTNNMVTMTVGDYAISWGYADVNGVKGQTISNNEPYAGNEAYLNLTTITQEILYPEAFADVDLQYFIQPDGVKENILLKTAQAQNTYTIQYRIDSLTAYQADEKTILLKDEEGNTIYILSAPCMTDAAGESSTAVTLTLISQKNKKLEVLLTADKDWLQAQDRVYPVTVDPYVQTEQTWNANAGAFISSANPDNQYGYGGNSHQGSLYVGRSSAYGLTRTLVRCTSLPELNKGDIVVNATLSLYKRNNDASMDITAHAITKDWQTNTVCWNSNITYDSTVLDYTTTAYLDDIYTLNFNITSLVKAWYNGADNYGVMLRSSVENETRNNLLGFYSTASYEVAEILRPLFTVIYRNNKGLESYWTYTQVSAGTAGVAYINDYTGNLVFVTSGVSTGGGSLPASLYAVYNGYMAGEAYEESTPTIGKGFRLNVQQTLLPSTQYGLSGTSAQQFPYVYTDGDGTEHYFYTKTENDTTTYWDEDGLGLQLLIDSASTTERYKITDDKDNLMAFYASGLLSYIQDSNGNKMTVNYDSTTTSLITGVTDGAGKTLQTQGYTSTYNLRDAAGRATYFNLDTNGYMVKAYYSTGDTYYTYDADGSLTSATDNDGYQIKFYYTSLATGKMVERVEEYGTDGTLGQVITFDRTQYNTTVIQTAGLDGSYGTADDICTTYQFDNYGRTISVESHTQQQNMGAAAYSYTAGEPNSTGSNIKQLNRLNKAHALGINTVNLLTNSGAEQTGSWTAEQWIADCSFTGSFSTTEKYLGQKSFQITVTEHAEYGRARYYQDLDNTILKPGHTYTLSGYVKTSNITNTTGNYGVCLAPVIFHDDGTFTDLFSEYVYGTTDTELNNGWRRLSITFTVPDNASKTRINLAVRNCTGTAWFDAIQIEEAQSPNVYNLVENSSFEHYSNGIPTNWSTSSTITTNSTTDYTTSGQQHHGTYAFQMTGAAATNKYIYQSIPISGTEDDIYILSGWAKANAVPDPGEDTRKFKISVEVKYSDGTSVWKTPVTFNYDITDWQFASTAFDLSDGTDTEKPPTAIVIYPRYTNQQNTVSFDQIQLIKDTAQSYTYDADGNLITVVDNAEQKSNMEYTNTDLTKYTDAKGYDYTYTYDDNHNLKTATSQKGVVSEYAYDSLGQAISLTVHNADSSAILNTTAGYQNGYLVSLTDTDGNSTIYTYDTSKGTLTSVQDATGTTNYTYNSSTDQLTSVQKTNTVDSTTQTSTINYTYTHSRLTKLQSPNTQYTFTYDVFGNALQTLIGSRSLVQYIYDAENGVLLRADFGNGDYVTYTYDQAGNVTAVSYNGTVKYEWKTDSAGRTTAYIDNVNHQQTNYEYDTTGRLIRTNTIDFSQSTNNDRSLYATEYTYDLNNNVTKAVNKTPSGTYITQTTYGQDNLPEVYTMQSGRKVTYAYDTLNRLMWSAVEK